MKKIIFSFGLIVLVSIAAMCAGPGSDQKQTNTETQANTIGGQTVDLTPEKYWFQEIPVTKGSKVKISYETLDSKSIDIYLMSSSQYNYFEVYGLEDKDNPVQYLKTYSGNKSEFQYTFPEDGLYFLVFNSDLPTNRQFTYNLTLLSGSELEDYDFVICEGYDVTIKKPEVTASDYYEYYRYCISYLEEGEVVNIYFSVQQNEYKNLFVKVYILDSKGYKSWVKSQYNYEGKIYFNTVNEAERSYEKVSWTVPKSDYYYIIFWNQNSPDKLKFDFKVYKD
jgi:hypothetical protein